MISASRTSSSVPGDARPPIAYTSLGVGSRGVSRAKLGKPGFPELLYRRGRSAAQQQICSRLRREGTPTAGGGYDQALGSTHVIVFLALAELVEMTALLLEVLLEASLVLPLGLLWSEASARDRERGRFREVSSRCI